jgi:hypothetical protein
MGENRSQSPPGLWSLCPTCSTLPEKPKAPQTLPPSPPELPLTLFTMQRMKVVGCPIAWQSPIVREGSHRA